LFTDYDEKQLHQQMNNKNKAYKALKLEAIEEAPLGLVICYDRSVLNNFTIGTVIMKQSSLVRSVRHKIFGFPNGTRIFHGLGFYIELLSV
jgi:hypothetical protein